MDTNTIEIKTLILSLIAIIATEFGGRIIMPGTRLNPMGVIGAVRIVEIILMATIVRCSGKGFGDIGLQLSKVIQGLKKGIVWSIGFGSGITIIFSLLYFMGMQPFALFIVSMPSDLNSILLLLCIGGIIGPIAEEIFFRGLLYGFFRRWGIFIAIVLSTSVFVLLHSLTSHIPVSQIAGGMVFAIAYEVEKNLMVPLTIHILGNMAIYSLSLIF